MYKHAPDLTGPCPDRGRPQGAAPFPRVIYSSAEWWVLRDLVEDTFDEEVAIDWENKVLQSG